MVKHLVNDFVNWLWSAFVQFLMVEDNRLGLNDVDLAGEIARWLVAYKFEIMATSSIFSLMGFVLCNRRCEPLTFRWATSAMMAYVAGLMAPVGLAFILAAWSPDQTTMLSDYREYVLWAGIGIFLFTACGIKQAIWPSSRSFPGAREGRAEPSLEG